MIELGSRREALLADVDGLERFESEYRVGCGALEADLESLAGQGPVAPSARPPIHEVQVPSAGASNIAESTPAPPIAAPAPAAPPLGAPSPASPQTPRPPSTDAGPPTAEIRGSAAGIFRAAHPSGRRLRPVDGPTRRPRRRAPPPSRPSTTNAGAPRAPLFPTDASDAEPLDDEAFFASLREAVSDQAPLGPRDELPDSTGSYEDDDAKSGLFRRRR